MTPRLSYFICATRRSGSWLLAGGLEDTRVAGHPSEWFNEREEEVWCGRWGIPHPIRDYRPYLDKVIEAGAAGTGVFGVKILGPNFTALTAKLKTLPECRDLPPGQVMTRIFPNLRYIRLMRRDKVRQAISYYRAARTDVWFDMEGHAPPPNAAPPPYDPAAIRRCETELADFDARWRDYFAGLNLDPLRVYYEDLAAQYEKTIRDVLGYIGVGGAPEVKIGPPRFRKQADAVTEEWVARYLDYKSQKALA
jgi:trehalose 2-sulfotransferase